jgi:hypothetical protein
LRLIGDFLSDIFKDIGWEEKFKLSFLQREWSNLFDEPLSLHMYPYQLNEKELIINVDSNVWLSQLKFFSKDIEKRLQPYGIKSVKFRYGRIFRKNEKKQYEKEDSLNKNIFLSESEQRWIEDILSNLNDKELKENIKKAIESSLKRKYLA